MVKEDIVEGMKLAVAKGESLYSAMLSFFNAGYSKDEIEEAARFLQKSFINKKFSENFENIATSSKPIQRVSDYKSKTESSGKTTMILLFILMFLLISVLISVFIFRGKLSEILGGLL